jgi:hypothetical protein
MLFSLLTLLIVLVGLWLLLSSRTRGMDRFPSYPWPSNGSFSNPQLVPNSNPNCTSPPPPPTILINQEPGTSSPFTASYSNPANSDKPFMLNFAFSGSTYTATDNNTGGNNLFGPVDNFAGCFYELGNSGTTTTDQFGMKIPLLTLTAMNNQTGCRWNYTYNPDSNLF